MNAHRPVGSLAATLALALTALTASAEPPPLEAYGNLPSIKTIAISPSGDILSLMREAEGTEILQVTSRAGEMKGVLDLSRLRARDTYFVSDKAVILVASETARVRESFREFQTSAAFGYLLDEQKVTQLIINSDIYPSQGGLGKIVGFSPDGKYAYMPAYESGSLPRYSLFRTELDTDRGRRDTPGLSTTVDWFVDAEGEPLIREDYDRRDGSYEVYAYRKGKSSRIMRITGLDRPTHSVYGVAPGEKEAVFYWGGGDGRRAGFYLLSLETGEIGEPIFEKQSADIQQIYVTRNREVLGVAFSGMTPSYEMLDPEIDRKMELAVEAFPGKSVSLRSWSDDFSKVILLVEGDGHVGDFFLLDTVALKAGYLAPSRSGIPATAVEPTEVFVYEARDGLVIEAVLTGAPAEGEPAEPLILLPHGGPAARDSISFDWMAQFFASRGYTVLQPNFRGSSGYGKAFAEAGYGEWGAKMQDDLSDGVAALAETGRIDPARVCIIGASYGGYAALMGGATTPDLYKCVVAIAPVSDLSKLLQEAKSEGGSNSPSLSYWKDQLGIDDIYDSALKGQSPVSLVENFDDPVLLLHGDDDLIVPIDHSEDMERALKRAGKSVKLVKLKDEDHWLSLRDTRIQLLREIDAFLAEHLPVD